MSWTDTLWSVGAYAYNTATNAVSKSFETLGNIACMLGGASLSAAYVVDESLSASYYATGNLTGSAHINITAIKFQKSVLEDMPFGAYRESSGSFSYVGNDFLEPSTLQAFGTILIGAGVVSKTIGANIRLWREAKLSQTTAKEIMLAEPETPGLKEYAFNSAQAISASLCIASMSHTITASVFQFSPLINHQYQFTYPSQSAHHINYGNYRGPVRPIQIPFHYVIDKNGTAEIYGIKLKLLEQILLSGNITGFYGAGVYFTPHNLQQPLLIPAAVTTGLSFLASSFFGDRARKLRDQQLLQNHSPHNYEEDNYRQSLLPGPTILEV